MPPRQRRAFVLHRIYGLTFREIGEQIGVSTATAHRLTRDALAQVMASLEDHDR
jgi:RNA polymerase sigma-70 factor (ECF subfamily)